MGVFQNQELNRTLEYKSTAVVQFSEVVFYFIYFIVLYLYRLLDESQVKASFLPTFENKRIVCWLDFIETC